MGFCLYIGTKPLFFMKTFLFCLRDGAATRTTPAMALLRTSNSGGHRSLLHYKVLLTAFTFTLYFEMYAQVTPPPR